jgi:hypothetical protein
MRTTIEIPDELREKLLQEAARHGERGYSRIVERALRFYFQQTGSEETRRARARRLRGSTLDLDLDKENERRSGLRTNWRVGAEE